MSLTSTPKSAGRRSARRASDPDDRMQRWVTIGFIGLIVLVGLVVLAGLAYGYWDSHLRPVASVGGTGISRDDWSARVRLEDFRLSRQEARVRSALTAEEIDGDEANRQLESIAAARQGLETGALERLIDLIHQSQLAAQEGVSVSDAEVEAAIAAAGTTPERRRVQAVVIQPVRPDEARLEEAADRQRAYRAALDAKAALDAGRPFDEVVATWSTDDSKEKGGDLGFLTADDATDPVWTAAIFALEPDGVTPILRGADGSYRIGRVTEIVPGQPDPAYHADLERAVGADTERRNVRLETIAQRLRDRVVADATGAEVRQYRLAEILVEGDTFVEPEEDEGRIHAAHILYSPNDDPNGAPALAEDDPAWEAAQADAQKAADELRAVTDPEARTTAFGERAAAESDDPGGAINGGDLGYFSRDRMVPEFADPLFDAADLQPGDVLGPIRSPYGWHVIRFIDREPPLAERLAAVTERLKASAADFGAIATELSDGAEAVDGGQLGWRTLDELDDVAAVAVAALEPGEVSEPLELDDGYHIYKLLEEARRPLDAAQRAAVEATAFDDWYDARRADAEDSGTITRDEDTLAIGG
jgi:parvulin-like peptidyl-prolyl isomerase